MLKTSKVEALHGSRGYGALVKREISPTSSRYMEEEDREN